MNLYERACQAFTKEGLEFVVIGGFAVNYWGYNRSTGDMDFYVNPSEKNINILCRALDELGFIIDQEAKNMINSGELIQFSDDHHIVELLFKINIQKSFQEVYSSAVRSLFGESKIPFIDFDDLILEKLKSKREKDLNDVYELKKLKGLL